MAQCSKSSPRIEPQAEYDSDTEPPESTDLQFLTFTDINQTTDPKTKKKVRSHVMHRVQRKARSEKRKERKGQIVLDISSLSHADAGPSRDPTNSMLGPPIVPHPCGLGSGRSDPFARYPIDMDVRTHELFDHCKIYLPTDITGRCLLINLLQCRGKLVLCSRP